MTSADDNQPDNEPAKPADRGHLADALAALEAAAAILRTRAEAAEKQADAAGVELRAAQTRADHATAERDEANRRANALQVMLDATKLELAGLRALIDVAPDAAAEVLRGADQARKVRGRLRRAWDGWWGR
jgi:hypothetical protein